MPTCPRCARLNPKEALFCYFDGHLLGDPGMHAAAAARQRFPRPFVFSGGKSCHTFDELALACVEKWDEARDMLRQGVFATFLLGMGRADLATAAREAVRLGDRDRALDAFLVALPTKALAPAEVEVDPLAYNAGTLRVGQDARFDLHLNNAGMGLVQGTISCEDCPWLYLGDPAARSKKKVIQFLDRLTIPVFIRGKALEAAAKPKNAKLLLHAGRRVIKVRVTVDVPVTPFPSGVLAGATTPRKIAEMAREHARAAADLFALGEVERWYQANGWTYPVQEPSASGVAAVQQFFEALGVSKAPKVGINITDVRLQGCPGDSLRSSFEISAQEKKPVWAHVVSDQAWLRPEAMLDGSTATILLRVPEVPDRPGEAIQARVTITTNGRQKFRVPVALEVIGAAPRMARPELVEELQPVRNPVRSPPPVSEVTPTRRPAPLSGRARPNWLLALVPLVFLGIGLSITLWHDLAAGRSSGGMGDPESYANLEQVLEIRYHDRETPIMAGPGGNRSPVGQGVWEPTMRFGLTLKGKPNEGRLTPEANGTTNNTVVMLNGKEYLFGDRPYRYTDGRQTSDWPGHWQDMKAKLAQTLRDGQRSVWMYETEKVTISQTVALVPGEQSNVLDTCLVRYKIENKDRRAHAVGLRFLLDTQVGSTDAGPFLVPEPGRAKLESGSADFIGKARIPDYLQALESEDLHKPGVVARVQLKLPGWEEPSRVLLGAWPDPTMRGPCRGERTMWDVPEMSIGRMSPPNAAVVLYWKESQIAPGGSREIGFAYGLGNLVSDAEGRLALTVGGAQQAGGELTVTAYVRNPVPNQLVTLRLSDGLTLASGNPATPVPPPGEGSKGLSAVTWRVQTGRREGEHSVSVQSSTGVTVAFPVQIRPRGKFAGP